MSKSNGTKTKKAPVSGCALATELAFYSCETDANEFNELLTDLHVNMHPSWSPEQLLYRPTYGTAFVNAVRARAGSSLPEEMILRRLRNIQKAGKH